MARFITFLIFLFYCFNSYSQNIESTDSVVLDSYNAELIEVPDSQYILALDSIIDIYEKQKEIEQVVKNYENTLMKKEMDFNWNSLVLLAKSVFTTKTNHRFRSRNALFEHHKSYLMDYAPAASPLAATWILKAAGLESRSKTKRMATANAIALGLGLGTASLMKSMVDEKRPDAHNNNSLPSGHATLAFISATILDREYGYYSPWIPIAGYSVAMATQFHRIHQNAHYLNDVVTGAGIGVVSTNLAYFITDRFFGEKEINRPFVAKSDVISYNKFLNKPTSFALYSNVETGRNHIDLDDCDFFIDDYKNYSLRSTSSLATALELSYFFDKNWSVETMARLTQTKVQVLDNANISPTIYGNNVYQYHFDLGAKYSMLIGLDKRMSVRAFAGERIVPATDFLDVENNVKAIRIKSDNSLEIGGGVAFDMLSTNKYISGFSVDYTHSFSSLFKNRWVLGSYFKVIL